MDGVLKSIARNLSVTTGQTPSYFLIIRHYLFDSTLKLQVISYL